ncbi:MAG: DUF6265 family protein [Planctomycetota bacterium]|jgi:hypothetical protein
MLRRPWRILVSGLGLALAGCQTTPHAQTGGEPGSDLAGLGWLTGSWVLVSGGAVSEEHWTRPRGRTMLGLNRTVIDGRTAAFEYVRIEDTPDGVVFLASPQGRHPPTPFALVESGPHRAVFENPGHDFPNRIVYERRGDRLDARIEGKQDGQPISEEWSWRRSALEAGP